MTINIPLMFDSLFTYKSGYNLQGPNKEHKDLILRVGITYPLYFLSTFKNYFKDYNSIGANYSFQKIEIQLAHHVMCDIGHWIKVKNLLPWCKHYSQVWNLNTSESQYRVSKLWMFEELIVERIMKFIQAYCKRYFCLLFNNVTCLITQCIMFDVQGTHLLIQ